MRVYIFGERSYDTPIKVTTIQLYTNIYSLAKRIIRAWSEYPGSRTLEDFMIGRYSNTFTVYVNELDKEYKPKRVKSVDIWESMKEEPRLEKEITKAMLKRG